MLNVKTINYTNKHLSINYTLQFLTLDAAGRKLSFIQKILNHLGQGLGFNQKPIVPIKGINLQVFSLRNMVRHKFLFLHGKKQVGADANHQGTGFYTTQCSLQTAPSPAHIMAVHRLSQKPVTISIESLDQFLSLIILIGRSLEIILP